MAKAKRLTFTAKKPKASKAKPKGKPRGGSGGGRGNGWAAYIGSAPIPD